MKKYISILILIISLPLFSFSQTSISGLRLTKAEWRITNKGYQSLTLHAEVRVNNAWLGFGANNDKTLVNFCLIDAYGTDDIKQIIDYPESKYEITLKEYWKHKFDVNTSGKLVVETFKDLKGWQTSTKISKSINFRIIEKNGLKEIQGIPNIITEDNRPKTETTPNEISQTQTQNQNQNQTPTSITLPINISVEENKTTNTPYVALVADETSSIRIKISNAYGSRIKYDIPYGLGSLKYKGGIQAKNEPKIDQYIDLNSGSATVFYHPPRYIDEQDLNSTITINGKQLKCAKVPIKLTYKLSNGNIQTENIELKILRPMVVLVHGFTGDASTWAQLADKLKAKGFDTMSDNYYDSNDAWGYLKSQDVFAQSRKLSNDIINAKKTYAQSNVKMLKVDVVTHSMGGLIGRYLVNGYEAYNKDVRKLFMVGTPNHGIGDIKQVIGAGAAGASKSHFGMLADVHEYSDFMLKLNRGENTGAHLNPDVEYYNIYGTVDDGVTSESSAYMPGVLFTRINKCCHSPSPGFLSALGTPLTVHSKAHDLIMEYLQKEIMRVPLKKIKAYIIQTKGEVWVDKGTGNRQVENTPYEVSIFDKIRTKDQSSLTIAFTVNGSEFGRLIAGQSTSLQLKNFSPQAFTVRVVKGKARFKGNGGHFQVEIQPNSYNKLEWYNFSPKIDLNALGTTFDVIYETDTPEINLIDGEIRLDDNENGVYKNYSTAQTLKVANNNISTFPLNKDSELNQIEASAPPVMKPNPLFTNVKAGGMLAEGMKQNTSNNTNTGSSSGNSSASTPINNQNCAENLTPKFLQKIGGASSDPQAQMIMRKLDNENKQEIYLFNKAKENFKNGIMPTQMNGTYRHQQNPSVFSRSYQCMTVTLFKPMKITGVGGNSIGFSLMREGQKYKTFNSNSDAIGTVLPCGSYKAYPNEVMGVSVIKLTLGKIE